jgi:acyl-coenzyme A thioesterase PaaI-like protein
VTAELSVKFLKPLPSGRQILVRARVVEQRRRILLVESELLLGETVHARAEVRVMEVRGGM